MVFEDIGEGLAQVVGDLKEQGTRQSILQHRTQISTPVGEIEPYHAAEHKTAQRSKGIRTQQVVEIRHSGGM